MLSKMLPIRSIASRATLDKRMAIPVPAFGYWAAMRAGTAGALPAPLYHDGPSTFRLVGSFARHCTSEADERRYPSRRRNPNVRRRVARATGTATPQVVPQRLRQRCFFANMRRTPNALVVTTRKTPTKRSPHLVRAKTHGDGASPTIIVPYLQ
jgi:hypothetical protein